MTLPEHIQNLSNVDDMGQAVAAVFINQIFASDREGSQMPRFASIIEWMLLTVLLIYIVALSGCGSSVANGQKTTILTFLALL